MFVTIQDFVEPPYELPNIDANERFPTYSDKQEKEMLRKILGLLLYEAFIIGVENLPEEWEVGSYALDALVVYGSEIYKSAIADNVDTPGETGNWLLQPEDRWLKLKVGQKYKYAGKTYEWVGMLKTFQPYIYSLWVVEGVDSNSGLGVVQSKAENADVVTGFRRVCGGHNAFADLVGNVDELKDTLYGYLYNSADKFLDIVVDEYSTIKDYLDETFKYPGRKNAFNL